MATRSELHFDVYARAQVILLDDPEWESSAFLSDISATAVELLAAEQLAPERIIVVDVESHLLLAEVRYSRRRGSRYAIGARRIHTLQKLDLAEDATRIEQVQALIKDFHLRLKKGIALPQALDTQAEELSGNSGQEPAPESLIERQKKPSENVASEPSRDEAEPGSEPKAGAEHELDEDFEPQPSITFHAIPSATEPVLPHIAIPARSQFSSPAMLQTDSFPAQVSSPAEPVTPPAPKPERPEVELPPKLAENKKRAFQSEAILAGTIAVLSATVLGALLFGPFRFGAHIFPGRSHPARISVPPAPPAPFSPPAPPALFSPPAPSPPPPPLAPAKLSPLEPAKPRLATITATENTWISACSDGRVVFENLLIPNRTLEVRYSSLAVLHLGNAGGVSISMDGKPVGPVGTSGMVRVVELLPDQIRLLPPNQRGQSRDCKSP
jgi:uncharacterized protein DUF4115